MAVNPWLAEQLAKKDPPMLSFILQVEPSAMPEVLKELKGVSDLTINQQAFNYVQVTAPQAAVPVLEKLPGVVMVSYNRPTKIAIDLTLHDPLLGQISMSNVVMPSSKINPGMFPPFSLMRTLSTVGPFGSVNIIPTSRSRTVMRDVDSALNGHGVSLAILDTGWSPNMQIIRAAGRAYSTATGDPSPTDGHSHGSWCQSAAAGTNGLGLYGQQQGIAPEADLMSVKVLNGLFGFGTDMDIIKGMELAQQKGAQVMSLSLGSSDSQGTEDQDPVCQVVNQLASQGIFMVIAAGNDGPGEETIGSPGCASGAITVGSVSIGDYPSPSWFSSRGPQAKSNPGGVMKPDVLAAGGGRALESATPDEVLYSGGYGWMSSLYTGLVEPQGETCMHGTSQATPQVAGLVACLLGGGLIKTPQDFKDICKAKGHAKTPTDGYGIVKMSWFV